MKEETPADLPSPEMEEEVGNEHWSAILERSSAYKERMRTEVASEEVASQTDPSQGWWKLEYAFLTSQTNSPSMTKK